MQAEAVVRVYLDDLVEYGLHPFPFKVGQGTPGGMGRSADPDIAHRLIRIYTLLILYISSRENCKPFGGQARAEISCSKR
jgi:hypothetical protein